MILAVLGLAVAPALGATVVRKAREIGLTLTERCTCALSKDVALVIDSSDSIDDNFHAGPKWESPQWTMIQNFVGGFVTRGQKVPRGDDWMVVQYGKDAAVTIPFGLSTCDGTNPAKCRTGFSDILDARPNVNHKQKFYQITKKSGPTFVNEGVGYVPRYGCSVPTGNDISREAKAMCTGDPQGPAPGRANRVIGTPGSMQTNTMGAINRTLEIFDAMSEESRERERFMVILTDGRPKMGSNSDAQKYKLPFPCNEENGNRARTQEFLQKTNVMSIVLFVEESQKVNEDDFKCLCYDPRLETHDPNGDYDCIFTMEDFSLPEFRRIFDQLATMRCSDDYIDLAIPPWCTHEAQEGGDFAGQRALEQKWQTNPTVPVDIFNELFVPVDLTFASGGGRQIYPGDTVVVEGQADENGFFEAHAVASDGSVDENLHLRDNCYFTIDTTGNPDHMPVLRAVADFAGKVPAAAPAGLAVAMAAGLVYYLHRRQEKYEEI